MDIDILGSIGSFLGGLFGAGEGVSNSALQWEAFEYNKQQNEITRQREDTAVQRRVKDLKEAGLSPTLAAGSSADSSSANKLDAPQSDIVGRMLTGIQMAKETASIKNVEASTANQLAEADKTRAETDFYEYQKDKVVSEISYLDASAMLQGVQAEYLGYEQKLVQEQINKVIAETDLTRANINLTEKQQELFKAQMANLYKQNQKIDEDIVHLCAVRENMKVNQEQVHALVNLYESQLATNLLENERRRAELTQYYRTGTFPNSSMYGSVGGWINRSVYGDADKDLWNNAVVAPVKEAFKNSPVGKFMTFLGRGLNIFND